MTGPAAEPGLLLIGAARARDVLACQIWLEERFSGSGRCLIASTGTVARCRRPGWEVRDAGLPPLGIDPASLPTGAGSGLLVIALSPFTVWDYPQRTLIGAVASCPRVLIWRRAGPVRELAGPEAARLLSRRAVAIALLRRLVLPVTRLLDEILVLAALALAAAVPKRTARRPRRVVQVIESLDTGGAQRQLLAYLTNSACPQPPITMQVGNAFYLEPFSRLGVSVVEDGTGDLRALCLPLLSAACELRLLLLRRRVDAAVGWLTTPIVLLPVAALGTGIRTAGNERNISDWKTWDCYRRWWVRPAEFLAARAHQTLLGNALAVARSYAAWIRTSPGRVQVVHNGIDCARFDALPTGDPRREYGLPGDRPIILSLGRLAVEKNFPMYLRALAALRDRGLLFHAVLAGHGECEADLRVQAQALDLGTVLTFTGRCERPQDLYRVATLVAMTSSVEGLPNVVIEAGCFSRPIVATPAGGTDELVLDGVTGFLVPHGDDAALIDRMGRLLADPALAVRMGRAARLRMERQFSIPRMVAGIDGIWRRPGGR